MQALLRVFQGAVCAALMGSLATAQVRDEVPVTLKELDVVGAIREFELFQQELERYRLEISEGKEMAVETAQMLEDLRASASDDNDQNEGPILDVIRGYVEGVISKQVDLVDFLESQRYRISYYANQMAASVRPEDLVLLFGSVDQNAVAVSARVRAVEVAQSSIAEFVDRIPEKWLDRSSFRPRASMPLETKQQLDSLLYRYQQERSSRDLAKQRLRLVREMQRANSSIDPRAPDVNPDFLLGQMFGALDRVRLQMSVDLLSLENFLSRFAQSSRTQEILLAFQRLVELQGGLEGPSPGLASVLDWLQTSSFRNLRLGAGGLRGPGVQIPQASDLLREAYQAARPTSNR